jgi:hypothetical protein
MYGKSFKSYLKSLLFGAFVCLMFMVNSFVGWFSLCGKTQNSITFVKPVNQVVPYTDTYTSQKIDDLSNYRLSTASGRCISDKAVI